jgi:hypothetical protein
MSPITVRMVCPSCDGGGRESVCPDCDVAGFRARRYHGEPEDIGQLDLVHDDDLEQALAHVVEVARSSRLVAWDYPQPVPRAVAGLLPEGPSRHDFEDEEAYAFRTRNVKFAL